MLIFATLLSIGLLVWASKMTVDGFRTGQMETFKGSDKGDRATQPATFWVNTFLNSMVLFGCGAILVHVIRTGTL